jgi:threonyl-tRNA synthetase
MRCEVDERREKISYKIREAQMDKVPYILIVGDKEMENGTVAVRHRGEGDVGASDTMELVNKIKQEIEKKL